MLEWSLSRSKGLVRKYKMDRETFSTFTQKPNTKTGGQNYRSPNSHGRHFHTIGQSQCCLRNGTIPPSSPHIYGDKNLGHNINILSFIIIVFLTTNEVLDLDLPTPGNATTPRRRLVVGGVLPISRNNRRRRRRDEARPRWRCTPPPHHHHHHHRRPVPGNPTTTAAAGRGGGSGGGGGDSPPSIPSCPKSPSAYRTRSSPRRGWTSPFPN